MTDVKIIADSIYKERGMEFRTTSFELTFPRIILSEFNTHRMFSRNTSSSRAIPFNKMVEVVQKNPFIPIAWQKRHGGMQGNSYIVSAGEIEAKNNCWKNAADNAIRNAKYLHANLVVHKITGSDDFISYNQLDDDLLDIIYADHRIEDSGVTKQLCNRLLEPFSWVKMVVTAETNGLNNFFKLRCPKYDIFYENMPMTFNSKKELLNFVHTVESDEFKNQYDNLSEFDWYNINSSQTEIHMQQLAEMMYDAMNESTPKELQSGDWHIPYQDKIDIDFLADVVRDYVSPDEFFNYDSGLRKWKPETLNNMLCKISTAMCARTSYTTIDDEKELDLIKLIKLHDKLIDLNHSSPLEHCRRAMTSDELYGFMKATPFKITETNALIRGEEYGVCEYSRGFIPYRYLVENKKL